MKLTTMQTNLHSTFLHRNILNTAMMQLGLSHGALAEQLLVRYNNGCIM